MSFSTSEPMRRKKAAVTGKRSGVKSDPTDGAKKKTLRTELCCAIK